jgi:hypothetical protein
MQFERLVPLMVGHSGEAIEVAFLDSPLRVFDPKVAANTPAVVAAA